MVLSPTVESWKEPSWKGWVLFPQDNFRSRSYGNAWNFVKRVNGNKYINCPLLESIVRD